MEEIFDSSVELLDTSEKEDMDKIKEPTLERSVLESEDIDTSSTLLKKKDIINEVITKFRAII